MTRGIVIENANDDDTEHVTVDLTVGDLYQVAGKVEWHKITRPFTISPNRCILIRSRERIMLPSNVFGVLCSKGSLSAHGLIVSNTKVDPIFGDHLNIPVFNAGGKPIEISSGMKFCSIYLQELEQPIPSLTYRKAVIQWTTKGHPIRDFLMMNSGTLIASMLGALITVGLTNCSHVFTSEHIPASQSTGTTTNMMNGPSSTLQSAGTINESNAGDPPPNRLPGAMHDASTSGPTPNPKQ